MRRYLLALVGTGSLRRTFGVSKNGVMPRRRASGRGYGRLWCRGGGITRLPGIVGLALISFLAAPAAGPQAPTADDELAAGISAREKGDNEAALRHLRHAVVLGPQMATTHFALGVTADDLCFSTAGPRPSAPLCELAIREYKNVLELDSSHEQALKNLAYLLYQFDRLDESESYYRKNLALHPDDPELLCAVASIDSQRIWRDVAAARAGLQSSESSLVESPSCREVRNRNQARVEEGLTLLTRAVRIREKNLDLLGFLSGFYFALAEIQCGNQKAYEADVSEAKKWGRRLADATARPPHDVFRKCPAPPPPPVQ